MKGPIYLLFLSNPVILGRLEEDVVPLPVDYGKGEPSYFTSQSFESSVASIHHHALGTCNKPKNYNPLIQLFFKLKKNCLEDSDDLFR